MADRLVSHLIEASSSSHLPTDAKANSQEPKLWVRKFCSEVGCDVLKKQDANGKTLLHHLLSGKSLNNSTHFDLSYANRGQKNIFFR